MRIKSKILITFIVLFVLLVPVFCWGGEGAVNLPNPLGEVKDPRQLIGLVISAVLGIVGSLALVVFIAGGLVWMTSGGNAEKVQKGKNMIIWAALGLAIIFFSYAVVRFIFQAVAPGERGGQSQPTGQYQPAPR